MRIRIKRRLNENAKSTESLIAEILKEFKRKRYYFSTPSDILEKRVAMIKELEDATQFNDVAKKWFPIFMKQFPNFSSIVKKYNLGPKEFPLPSFEDVYGKQGIPTTDGKIEDPGKELYKLHTQFYPNSDFDLKSAYEKKNVATTTDGGFDKERDFYKIHKDVPKQFYKSVKKGVKDFSGKYLANMDLSEKAIGRTHVEGVKFIGANMENSNFASQTLEKADFTNAKLMKTKWRRARLYEAIFDGADLTGADLTDAFGLHNASFKGAVLRNAKLNDTIPKYTNFSGADLRGAEFLRKKLDIKIELDKANFTGADLRGANLQFTQMTETVFDNADLRGANLKHVYMTKTSFAGADLRGANLDGAFIWLRRGHVAFFGANFSGHDFSGRDLRWTNLSGANLRGANFQDADLRKANLSGADLRGADFTDAKIKGMKIKDAQYDKTTKGLPKTFIRRWS
jgi:uncharacterized protein YjbI with pentapeptide repeats